MQKKRSHSHFKVDSATLPQLNAMQLAFKAAVGKP